MLILQNASYRHPDGEVLFGQINLNIQQHSKVALIGNNGVGKSTLLSILAGNLSLSQGQVTWLHKPYYVPQIFGQFNHFTVADALGVAEKVRALNEILNGSVTEENLSVLNDDWTIEERCREALLQWRLGDRPLTERIGNLSGGQKMSVFLAGVSVHKPELVLLDEPCNHLDAESRDILYNYIKNTSATVVVVSHDRTLLGMLDAICELTPQGISLYGGNYDFYLAQKDIERNAHARDLANTEKTLRKARETERAAVERQNKLDARGRKKQEKAGLPVIVMNTLRNNAERTTARVRDVHASKVGTIREELAELRNAIPDTEAMKFGFNNSSVHNGKVLVTAESINVSYNGHQLWAAPVSFNIFGNERILISGRNGSGKTSVLRMIMGDLVPASGSISRLATSVVYIDQDYSLIRGELSVYAQAQKHNSANLDEHEVKIRLARHLFGKDDWDKSCHMLSGGEKMRLMLCCIAMSNVAPDMLLLDEPTNNLDIQNAEILTAAVNNYKGTLIVISHDSYFVNQIKIDREIVL
jgi:ATPase subunit of ABC transporter with duplicated ATPase domains